MDSNLPNQPVEVSLLPTHFHKLRQSMLNHRSAQRFTLGTLRVGLICSLVYAGVGLWFLFFPNFLFLWATAFMMFGLGLVFVLLCKNVLRRFHEQKDSLPSYGPVLTLSSEGITYYRLTGPQLVPWHDIESLALSKAGWLQRYDLAFNLRKTLGEIQPFSKRANTFLNRLCLGFDEQLPLLSYPLAQEVLQRCQQWHQAVYPHAMKPAVPRTWWWRKFKRWDRTQHCYQTRPGVIWGWWGGIFILYACVFLNCIMFMIEGLTPTPLVSEFKGDWQWLENKCCDYATVSKLTWDPNHIQRHDGQATFRVRRDFKQLPDMYHRDTLISKTLIETYTLDCPTGQMRWDRAIDLFINGRREAQNDSFLTNFHYWESHSFSQRPIYLYRYATPETIAYIKREACQLPKPDHKH